MSLHDLRTAIESAIPWWIPYCLAAVTVAVYLIIERKGRVMMYCVNCECPVKYDDKLRNLCPHCGKDPDKEEPKPAKPPAK